MGHRSQEFLASTGDLTGLLSLEEGTERALQRVTDLAASVVEAADGVGITLVSWGRQGSIPSMRTAAYSDPWVDAIDVDQYGTGEGPCIDAILMRDVVHLRSMNDSRYPKFSARAIEEGLGSVLAVPLAIDERAMGALNLYARQADAFDPLAEAVARSFAAQAAVALINIELYEGSRKLSDQLGEAMESRAFIEQAKGILMGREHCSADLAFEQMKMMSQKQNLKVSQIAINIISEGAITA